MTLLAPWALLGLVAIPLLILLDRWHRRPRPIVWPSLLLWRNIAPASAPSRRRIEPLLLLECLAALLLTAAAAGPQFTTGTASRTVVVHLETGPRTGAVLADGRTVLEATRAELDRIQAAVGGTWTVIEMPRADAPPASGDLRILATNRADILAPGVLVVGRAPTTRNIGIDALLVDGDRMGFSVRGEGVVSVLLDGEATEVQAGTWYETTFRTRVQIASANCHPGDDTFELRLARLKVRLDSESPLLLAALGAGVPAELGEPADLVISTTGGEPIPDAVRGADCVAGPGIFESLFLDDCRWLDARGKRSGALLRWRDWTLASWTGNTLWLGLPVAAPWDEHGTLALLLERAKRERIAALLRDGEALAGTAFVRPAPGFIETDGVDRPWDGSVPPFESPRPGSFGLRAILALLATGVLILYLVRLRRS